MILWRKKVNNLYQDYDKNHLEISEKGTGDFDIEKEFKIKEVLFDKYIIKVKLTLNGKFVGIEEISFDKDFLSYKQKILKHSVKDVEEYYIDDEDGDEFFSE